MTVEERRRPAVGAQVKRWRADRGLTLANVAERTGLNVGYLSQIENDKASPSLACLASLGDALDVPIAWFLMDEVHHRSWCAPRSGRSPSRSSAGWSTSTGVRPGTSRSSRCGPLPPATGSARSSSIVLTKLGEKGQSDAPLADRCCRSWARRWSLGVVPPPSRRRMTAATSSDTLLDLHLRRLAARVDHNPKHRNGYRGAVQHGSRMLAGYSSGAAWRNTEYLRHRRR